MQSGELLGRKNGRGFYLYEGKQQLENKALEQWRNKSTGEMNDEQLRNQLVLLMVNEAAHCIEEKVVNTPEDADYGMVLGTGFAPFRGGPLRFAEHLGLKQTVEQLDRLASVDGPKFAPAEILRTHVRNDTKFYES
jgi:3-hydroxyacyl-CoA dehydrogenase/enoyl-CoA hydratase/3-hydroxybutyryl-CoA epimerase